MTLTRKRKINGYKNKTITRQREINQYKHKTLPNQTKGDKQVQKQD